MKTVLPAGSGGIFSGVGKARDDNNKEDISHRRSLKLRWLSLCYEGKSIFTGYELVFCLLKFLVCRYVKQYMHKSGPRLATGGVYETMQTVISATHLF